MTDYEQIVKLRVEAEEDEKRGMEPESAGIQCHSCHRPLTGFEDKPMTFSRDDPNGMECLVFAATTQGWTVCGLWGTTQCFCTDAKCRQELASKMVPE